MAVMQLAFSAYKRTAFPEAVTVNCFSEKAPTKATEPEALLARAGLEELAQVGNAPIRAVFQKQGLFGDAALILSNTTVYALDPTGSTTTYTGALPGSDLVDIDAGLDADYNSVARIATGSAMYLVTAGNVAVEDFPVSGGAGASSVCFHKGYWLGVEAGSDAVYYQIPAATTWNALQFASAEYSPDKLVAIRSFGELIALLGESSTEMWRATGNASSPLEPYGGMSYPIGCRSRDTAVNCLGTLIWVTDTCLVVSTSGGEPQVVSDNGLAEQIRRTAAGDLRASPFAKDGHRFYRLTLGGAATWDYDLSTRRWARANSQGQESSRAHLFANLGDTVIAADSTSSQVWRVDPDVRLDGEDTFTMEFTAFIPPGERPMAVGNIVLHCEQGDAPLTGQGSAPQAWLQISKDGGKSFGPKKYRDLGATGQSMRKVRWLGPWVSEPENGLVVRFGISDPIMRRISGVYYNVP